MSEPLPRQSLPEQRGAAASKRKSATKTIQKANGAQAIDRALSVLRCFGMGRAEFSLTEISNEVSLSPSTAHRILRALINRGFLVQNGDTGGYRLGGAMVLLGEAAHKTSGIERAIPILSELARLNNDSVSLGIREGTTVGVLHRIESSRELRFSQQVGTRVPLHASAMGKAILSGAADIGSEIAALGELPALTKKTICDPAKLAEEIRLSAARGFTIDDEEQVIGVRCVGAPVRDRGGAVRAAFAIQAPRAHMSDQRITEMGAQMRAFAQRLAEAMHLD
jgi:IclR family acetate operon transcriptional repressor